MAQPEDPLLGIDEIVQAAFEEAERKEYHVVLPAQIARTLENQLRLSVNDGSNEIFYSMPSDEEFTAMQQQRGENDVVVRRLSMVKKLRGDIEIDPISNNPPADIPQDQHINTFLTEGDMDYVNTHVLANIAQTRNFPVEWLTNPGEYSDPTRNIAEERRVWREVLLQGIQEDAVLFRKMNEAFIQAGAHPRPGYTTFFERPQE
jgi:hypothetical protein